MTGWPQAICLPLRDFPRSLRSGPRIPGRCSSLRPGFAPRLGAHVPRRPRLQKVYGLPPPRRSPLRRTATGSSRSEPRRAWRSLEWPEINAGRATRFTKTVGVMRKAGTLPCCPQEIDADGVALRAGPRRTTLSLCRVCRFRPKPSICSASFSPHRRADRSPHGPQITARHLLPSSPASRMPSWRGS